MTFSITRFLTTSKIQVRRLVGAIRYGLQRDRLEAAYRNRSRLLRDLISPLPPVVTARPQGVCIDFHDVKLRLDFTTANTIEIQWQTGDEREFYWAVASEERPLVAVEFTTTEAGWQIQTAQLRVQIKRDGRLDFYNCDECLIRQEYPPQRWITGGEPEMSPGWQHRAKLQLEEHIYGLGERAQQLDLRGSQIAYRLWNTDPQGKYQPGEDPLYISIPVYIGLHSAGCYLVFYDNPCDGTIEFSDVASASFAAGALRYYVSVGEMPALLDAYTQLTGRPALPPRWAFGYHHCRWGYEKESALRAIFRKMKVHKLPIVAMHLDIDCLADFKPFTIATDRFPTLKEFAEELAVDGIKTILILHPCMNADVRDRFFQEGVANKFFCTNQAGDPIVAPLWAGDSVFIDFTNPAARSWWSQQYQQLLDLGFSGFWHDMNEPATSTLWGDPTLPAHTTYHDFAGVGGTHLEAHNLTGLQQAQAGYERLRASVPDKRPFILSRSGWAGIQKYAWVWTGDLLTGWDSLRQTIPMLLNLGLSGIPYSGPDIGGFIGHPSPELFLRWFQLACFLPFCRTHGNKRSAPRLPWAFGDRVLDGIRAALDLRSALLPYFYTLSWEANHSGAPLVRPLFWTATDRVDLWNVEDTFLLGDALLVAPIVVKEQQERQIPLPPGDWYDFWSDLSWRGQPQITVPVTLDRIPVLVKAGSILPMAAAQRLILHCYPDRAGNCSGTIYSDALDGYAPGRIDRFDLVHDNGKWQLNWEATGEYPFPYDAVRFTMYGVQLDEVRADECPIDFTEGIFTIAPFQSVTFTGSLQSLG